MSVCSTDYVMISDESNTFPRYNYDRSHLTVAEAILADTSLKNTANILHIFTVRDRLRRKRRLSV